MMSRNIYFQLFYRTILLTALALTAGTVIAVKGSWMIVVVCLLAEVPVIFNMIRYLNTTNRKVGYFLESIQNNDYALLFPSKVDNKPLSDLYQSLKKINGQVQKLQMENLQREQFFQTLLEHIPTGVIAFNTKGFIYQANTSAKKLLSLEVLTHIQQIERVNPNLYTTVKNIGPFEQKMVSLNNERGKVGLSLKSSLFKMKEEELILLSIQDIRNELDENELNSWMKLIRVLMHEIMNTITPVTSLSKGLSRYLTVDGRTAFQSEMDDQKIQTILEGLQVINDQGKSLMHFVESYRKLTHLPQPDKKVFRVEDLITRIKVLYSSLENSGDVKLETIVDPVEMELFADENLISLVLINLLKNALEAIGKNPSGQIHLHAAQKNGKVGGINKGIEITLIDNGPGIQGEILEHIFTPFFTTREKGSGIGLSLSRQIMKLHGGTLQVQSIPEKQTSFSMVF